MSLQSSIISNLASVQADMNYLAPMLERPRNYTFEPPPGVPRSNTINEAHRVAIHDARPVADRVSLDANGLLWSIIAAPCATSSTTRRFAASTTLRSSAW